MTGNLTGGEVSKIKSTIKSKGRLNWPLLVVVTGVLLATGLAWAAQFYGGAVSGGGLTAVTNGVAAATTNTAFDVPQNVDLVIQPYTTCWAANTNNSPTTLGFNLTSDGTNWSTGYPITCTITNNGTTLSYGWCVVSRTNLTGASKMRWDYTSCANTSGAVIGCRFGYFY